MAHFDSANNPSKFFVTAFAAVAGGLLLGGALDTCIRKLEGDDSSLPYLQRKYGKSAAFFALQAALNIFVFVAILRVYPRFTEWFQLSISGALFAVVLFAVQTNLVNNALKITNVV